MKTKTISALSMAEKARRAAKLSVAAVFAVAAMTVAAPGIVEAAPIGFLPPDSDIGFADTDGNVPLYQACFPGDLGAFYAPYTYDGVTVEGSIVVNICALERLGAGPNDIAVLLEHEMGHARGLLHSDDPNDIMYAYLPLTGT